MNGLLQRNYSICSLLFCSELLYIHVEIFFITYMYTLFHIAVWKVSTLTNFENWNACKSMHPPTHTRTVVQVLVGGRPAQHSPTHVHNPPITFSQPTCTWRFQYAELHFVWKFEMDFEMDFGAITKYFNHEISQSMVLNNHQMELHVVHVSNAAPDSAILFYK